MELDKDVDEIKKSLKDKYFTETNRKVYFDEEYIEWLEHKFANSICVIEMLMNRGDNDYD